MAGKNAYPLYSATPGQYEVCGSFQCNGTSQPSDFEGSKYIANRNALGNYKILIPDTKFAGVISVYAAVSGAASGVYPFRAYVSPQDFEGKSTRFFIFVQDFTAAPVAADIGERLNFCFRFRDTSQRK